jgi:uncharacterized membrane protein
MATHAPQSIEELKKLGRPSRNVNIVHKEHLTQVERIAVWVTGRIGTMGFFFIIVAWTIIWLGWNIFAPQSTRFDPYPAFVLWLFISNMIQIFLMPLIMVGQNLQGRHSEARAEADFDVNVRAEGEIEAILMHLENQNDLMLQILRKLEDRNKPIGSVQATPTGSSPPPSGTRKPRAR